MSDEGMARVKRTSHRKSRLGCFQCKRRKIKCQETRPMCDNCLQKGFPCEYPPKVTYRIVNPVEKVYESSPREIVKLEPTPTTFTLEDMRLFHHFLLRAYPHLPLGNDETWVNEIPTFAHRHEYLMHAMLGLAASHLTLVSSSDLKTTAFAHRVKAVAGLNNALSRYPTKNNEADAMLATCYALTFQSSYLADGLGDFLTMIRGCALMTTRISEDKLDTAFKFIDYNGHFRVVLPRLTNLPIISIDLRKGAKASLELVRPLCTDHVECVFFGKLFGILDGLDESSLKGYMNFIRMYAAFHEMPYSAFPRFIDPTNHVAQILLGHFIAIQLMVSPISMREIGPRIFSSPPQGTFGWLDTIFENLPKSMRKYLGWPMEVLRNVRLEVAGESSLVPIWRGLEGLSSDSM